LHITIHYMGSNTLGKEQKNDEIRWQIVKVMLDESPSLKEKVKDYLQERRKK